MKIEEKFPSTPKGTAKVVRLGIKIYGIWYSCPEFRKPGISGQNVHVRYDPYNASVAYAYVNNKWRRCTSKGIKRFSSKSELGIKMCTAELRKP